MVDVEWCIYTAEHLPGTFQFPLSQIDLFTNPGRLQPGQVFFICLSLISPSTYKFITQKTKSKVFLVEAGIGKIKIKSDLVPHVLKVYKSKSKVTILLKYERILKRFLQVYLEEFNFATEIKGKMSTSVCTSPAIFESMVFAVIGTN